VATPSMGAKTCSLTVNIFSGARTPLPNGTELLLTLRDGNQQTVSLPNNGFFRKSSIRVTDLPFHNNFGDSYAVVVSADGFQQVGFHPVNLSPTSPGIVDLMLLKSDPDFSFRNATWDRLNQNYKSLADLFGAGAADNNAAATRYEDLMEDHSDVLACTFNLLTSMSQVNLPAKTPFFYLKELIWDRMQPDRFFGWADPALIDQVIRAADQGVFASEPGTAIFHPGATRSWKQVQFGEANLQLTFHENDRKTVAGVNCVLVEPDIDYFKDPLAHALFEVVTNSLTHSLTDPRQVYVLRWMAGRHAGVPDFDPPYTLV